MKELICIVCPKGCHLQVDEEHDYTVTGNSCPRGAEYGKAELTHPTRVVTSTVRCEGRGLSPLPRQDQRPYPQGGDLCGHGPAGRHYPHRPRPVGQVVVENVRGTGVDFVATRNM